MSLSDDSIEAFERLLDDHPDPAWIHDAKTLRFLKVNGALTQASEFSREELLRMRVTDLFPEAESIDASKPALTMTSRSGRSLELNAASHSVNLPGQEAQLVVARVRASGRSTERRLDLLQGNEPARKALTSALKNRVQRLKDSPDRRFALLMVEIDRYKLLVRSLGTGDANQLMTAVARRLEALLHPDEAMVRLENDRLAILLEGVVNAEGAIHMAREVQGELEAPFTSSGHEVYVTASVGVAIGTPEITEPAELMKNADFALHEAKAQGIGGHRVFAPEMRAREAKDRRMEMDLRPGIERGDLKAYFQPIISLRSGQLAGFEALARWHHPDLGLLMPAQFIPLAESTGIIADLGKQMMVDACKQVCEWQSRFRGNPPLFVTVNCSGIQFVDPKFATLVRWALVSSGLPPTSLKLELTESVLMEDNPGTRQALDRILELGVQLMIDDFGTGYSSLSRLHTLPIETLKIDRSFVSPLVEDPDSQTMTRAIIQMARNFDLKVTAEGVETEGQLKILRRLDCDFAQGFLFSKAMEPAKAEQMLATRPSW